MNNGITLQAVSPTEAPTAGYTLNLTQSDISAIGVAKIQAQLKSALKAERVALTARAEAIAKAQQVLAIAINTAGKTLYADECATAIKSFEALGLEKVSLETQAAISKHQETGAVSLRVTFTVQGVQAAVGQYRNVTFAWTTIAAETPAPVLEAQTAVDTLTTAQGQSQRRVSEIQQQLEQLPALQITAQAAFAEAQLKQTEAGRKIIADLEAGMERLAGAQLPALTVGT